MSEAEQIQLARIKVVIEDLHFVSQVWRDDATAAILRIGCTALRRLLHDNGGELLQSWNFLNMDGKLTIHEVPNIEATAIIEKDVIQMIAAVHCHVQGLIVHSPMLTRADRPPAQVELVSMPIGKFLSYSCFIYEGQRASFRSLLLYVANKLGGVHFDPKLQDSQHIVLRDHADGLNICGHNAVYVLLLTIGQRLVSSSDVHRFIDLAKKRIGNK